MTATELEKLLPEFAVEMMRIDPNVNWDAGNISAQLSEQLGPWFGAHGIDNVGDATWLLSTVLSGGLERLGALERLRETHPDLPAALDRMRNKLAEAVAHPQEGDSEAFEDAFASLAEDSEVEDAIILVNDEMDRRAD